jgi:hypothetical protein
MAYKYLLHKMNKARRPQRLCLLKFISQNFEVQEELWASEMSLGLAFWISDVHEVFQHFIYDDKFITFPPFSLHD